jgi:protein-disulfide isomerase
MTRIQLSILGAIVILTGISSTYAQEQASFSDQQKQEIGKIAADYLVEHPEIMVKVSQALQVKQQKQALAQQAKVTASAIKNHQQLMNLQGIPYIGPQDAKVTITEFFDYQCFYCNKVAPVVEQLMQKNPDVKFIFRDWPIFASRWENSAQAAYTGLEIWKLKGPQAYIKYHNGIYHTGHNEGALTKADIQTVARVALDTPLKDFSDKDFKKTIQHNNDLAHQLGFTGTPGFIITPAQHANSKNTIAINGAVSAEILQKAIDNAAQ